MDAHLLQKFTQISRYLPNHSIYTLFIFNLFQSVDDTVSFSIEFFYLLFCTLHTYNPNVSLWCCACGCLAEEHLAELMPIFEQLRAKGEVGNAYPMQVGSTSGPTVVMAHGNPYSCYRVIYTSHIFLSCFNLFYFYTYTWLWTFFCSVELLFFAKLWNGLV